MTSAGGKRPPEPPELDQWDEGGLHELLGIHGFEVAEDGEVTAKLTLTEAHENPSKLVHGGVIFSLIDSTIAAAVLETLDEHEWMATESTTIDFMRPATGTITARARVDRRGRLTAYAAGDAVDEDGKVVARASAVWAIRSDDVQARHPGEA